ncbi:MAG: hypothetical protein MUF34_34730 [Polyangiaceae bacterium]|nr:hypothetical protein [Polyangiaceae bacterium]
MSVRVWLLAPAAAQALAMAVDEGWFHRRRGLPRWERVGHPIDTASVALCYGWLLARGPGDPGALETYVALAALSCLLVTKDEFVHARHCAPGEQWLHAVLFVLHPVVFLAFGALWREGAPAGLFAAQLALTLAVMMYQIAYWSLPWKRSPVPPAP